MSKHVQLQMKLATTSANHQSFMQIIQGELRLKYVMRLSHANPLNCVQKDARQICTDMITFIIHGQRAVH